MPELAVYRLTTAEPDDGPLVTLDGVPIRVSSVDIDPIHHDDDEIGETRSGSRYRPGGVRYIEVGLRVLPDALSGNVMTTTVAQARPFSGTDLPDGGYLDAAGGGSWLEVREDEPGRPVIVIDGEPVAIDKREAWTLITELAAIIGHRPEPELRTAAQWELSGLVDTIVVDPDGWREAGAPAPEDPITLEEYRRRAGSSTSWHRSSAVAAAARRGGEAHAPAGWFHRG